MGISGRVACVMDSNSHIEEAVVIEDCIEESIEHSNDPALLAIFKYWQKLKGTALAPCWPEWDWMSIPTSTIRHCGVVDVIRTQDNLDFVYRFWGSAHVSANKQELTNKSVNCMKPLAEAEQVFFQYRTCYERREPCLFNTTIRNTNLNITIEERSLRLPFVGVDDESITQLMTYSFISGDANTIRRVLVDDDEGSEY